MLNPILAYQQHFVTKQQKIKSLQYNQDTYQILKLNRAHLSLTPDCNSDGTVRWGGRPAGLTDNRRGNLVLFTVQHVVADSVSHVDTLDVLELNSEVNS